MTIFDVQSYDRELIHWEDHLLDLTPVEKHGAIHWKRDDFFAPLGDRQINGSKLRQLIWLFSQKQYPGVVSGAVTGSPQLPMVAACAKHWGIPCIQVIPGKPETSQAHDMVRLATSLGAKSKFQNPGYPATLNRFAQKMSASNGYLHVETNITVEHRHRDNLPGKIEAFHRVGSEQVKNIPEGTKTLIIPAGSCNSLTSILYGLARFKPPKLERVILLRIMANATEHRQWTNERLKIIGTISGTDMSQSFETIEYDLVDSGFTKYSDMMPYSLDGIDFHPRYEGKCLNYIEKHNEEFKPLMKESTLFWIIGSQPT